MACDLRLGRPASAGLPTGGIRRMGAFPARQCRFSNGQGRRPPGLLGACDPRLRRVTTVSRDRSGFDGLRGHVYLCGGGRREGASARCASDDSQPCSSSYY